MKTILLLAGSDESKPLFAEALGPHVNLVLVQPPVELSREKFDAIFVTWLRLVDAVLVDFVSLDEAVRWALESLAAAKLGEHQAVVLRLTAAQRAIHHVEPHWLLLSDTDTPEQTRSHLWTFLDLREAQANLKRAHAVLGRQGKSAPAAAPLVTASELLRYREALRNIGEVLGKNLDEQALLEEFLHFLRELLGVGKLALFTRPYHNDLFTERLALEQRHLAIATSHGIAPNLVEHLRLSLDFGIGGHLEREAKILRRAAHADTLAPDHDPQVAREFELLGVEVAVPMFDNDQLLGALTFSGKVTGEALTNEELEMVYHLLAQLAQAIRNLHLQAKIVGQQRFMSEVLAHAQSGVIAVGEDDRLLCVNPHARELLELGDGNLVGQDMRCLPPCVGDTLFEVLQTGQEIWQREVILAGSRRPISVSATRFATSLGDGKSLVAVALVEDLTQAKLQQAQTRELADKEFFTRLASRLSHELKNSLVSIKIHAQLLPERYDEREFRDQFSRIVSHEVNRVDMLVNNLTFFSHPLTLNYELITLEQLLDGCIRSLTDEFARKQLLQIVGFGQTAPAGSELPVATIKKTLSGPPQFEGDRVRLIQAFEHLMRNALQAMPKGGRLTISSTEATAADFADAKLPDGGAIRILWEDGGEGIALEQLPRVTEPFITTRNVGVGLGLTIVKRILERHSGRFLIDSLLGGGTKDHIDPAVESATAPGRPHGRGRPERGRAGDGDPMTMPRQKVLCIDDEESPRESLRQILKDRYDVVIAVNGQSGLETLRTQGPFDAVLLDMKMPDLTGLEVLEQIVKSPPAPPVVMVTAITDARTAVQAMKMGAADYLSKPFDVEEIRLVVERVIRERSVRKSPAPVPSPVSGNILGASPAMQRVFNLIGRLKDTETTVLICGETGTGKELVARALHFHSRRKDGPFVPVHCAAIPNELLESELFGHEKGSFTGALARRIGMFEAAHGGTLFLDEIGEMPIGTQSKLLRAIQEREIRRVGSQETIHINVRLVCATNRDLEEDVKHGRFREDLFYRINVVPIPLPPLRDRREDIPTLVLHFTQRFAKELNRSAPQFTAHAMARLLRYPWPGNVRELEHAIERLMVICDAAMMDVEHLPSLVSEGDASMLNEEPSTDSLGFQPNGLDLPKLTENLERQAIEEALRRTGGVISDAARLLHMTRRVLRYKMDQLGIVGRDTD